VIPAYEKEQLSIGRIRKASLNMKRDLEARQALVKNMLDGLKETIEKTCGLKWRFSLYWSSRSSGKARK